MNTELTSPLAEQTAALGAKFAEFGGWNMPLSYSGILQEHAAVRERVGIFDVSHLGKVWVRGPGAADYLNTRLTNDFSKIRAGKAQYTLLCDEHGGVVDDLIAYLHSPDEVLLVPNAAHTTIVTEILRCGAPAAIQIENQHRDYAVLAIQGPQSSDLLAELGFPTDLEYMAFESLQLQGAEMTVCRSGYTGEMGFELIVPNAIAPEVWDRALGSANFPATPCGLGARDTLRTEMGYPLCGQDLSAEIDPVSANLSWAIGWRKPTFDGAAALRRIKAAGPLRRLRGLLQLGRSRGIPRPGMALVDASQGTEIGVVTSGTFSPTLRKSIALALVDAEYDYDTEPFDEASFDDADVADWALDDDCEADVEADTEFPLVIEIRDQLARFRLVQPPFVSPSVR